MVFRLRFQILMNVTTTHVGTVRHAPIVRGATSASAQWALRESIVENV